MITAEAWQAQGTLIDYQGHRIFTVEAGSPEGAPVLFLHGFPTSSHDFARIVSLLADRYRLILFDFLGYGFSDKPRPHHYSLFEQADIAQHVAAHYGMARGFLVAHDMGDSVALELMRRPAPVFEKVVLLNGSVLLDDYRPLLLQRLLLHPIIGPTLTALRLVKRRGFGAQFGSVFAQRPPESEIDEFWKLIEHNDGPRIYHLLIRYLNERIVHQHAWLDALQAHTAPLTVIWGQRDPVSVPSIAQVILDRRPDATYHRLDDIGHYPQWEAPDRVATAIQQVFA